MILKLHPEKIYSYYANDRVVIILVAVDLSYKNIGYLVQIIE